MFSETRSFLQNGIWKIQTSRLTARESFLIHLLRIFVLSVKKFQTDLCALRASALTFYTLLSIVPALAMALGIAEGFGLEEVLERKIIQTPAHEMVMVQLVDFSRNMLLHTRGGIVAGAGVVLLFWIIVKMLGNIERSFNDIWGVKRSRSLARKFSDYLSLIFVCPILLVLASGITVFISNLVHSPESQNQIRGLINPILITSLFFLPFLILWSLLTFLYLFIPNAKVKFGSALAGAFVASALYQAIQWTYIHFQIGVAQFNAIYGSFAAFPLFLIWLQLSWMVVLYGAQIAFAKQYEQTYEFEPESRWASSRLKAIVAVLIIHRSIKRFERLQNPLSAHEFSGELGIPIHLIQDVLSRLMDAHLLSVVGGRDAEEGRYQPGRPIEGMTLKNILDSLDQAGVNNLSLSESSEMEKCRQLLERLWSRLDHAPENILVKDIELQSEAAPEFFEKKAFSSLPNAS